MHTFTAVFVALALSVSLAGIPQTAPGPIRSHDELRAALAEVRAAPDEAAARAGGEALWRRLADAGQAPLVLGDRVFFFYLGDAASVAVRGDFTGWDYSAIAARRIGDSNLWMAEKLFPTDARGQYKFVVNGKTWLLDAANPNVQVGGLGDNSVVQMPGYRTTRAADERAGVAKGRLSAEKRLHSQSLGYPVAYRVYTPVGYEALKDLPVLYVTDGNDWWDEDMGGLTVALDNLIADRKIPPMLAALIDAREPGNPKNNRREVEFLDRHADFGEFVATEFVPAIDRAYRTDATPDARVIQGVSFGGLIATYIAAVYPQVFHKAAIFSPSYWAFGPNADDPSPRAAALRAMSAAVDKAKACDPAGATCATKVTDFFMSWGIPDWDVGDLTPVVAELTAAGTPVLGVRVQEGHSWHAWSGLLDEMLTHFFEV